MKAYLKIMNLIQEKENNTAQILKYLSKIPESHLEYGMDYEDLKKENDKLEDKKKEVLLTIPELCCLSGKTKILLYYKEKNYNLTQLKERQGIFTYTKNSKEENIYFRPGLHNLLSCLICHDIDQAAILKEKYNIDLFSTPEAVKNAAATATLFFDKNIFLSLCLDNKYLDYIDFLNNNIEMVINNISYIFKEKGIYTRKIFDTSFIFHEILNITGFLKKTDEDKKLKTIESFLLIDKYNNFIFSSQLKKKHDSIFNAKDTTQIIFNCMSKFKDPKKIENQELDYFIEGCKIINWDAFISGEGFLSLVTKIMEHLIKNNDLKNFNWLLSETKFFDKVYLIDYFSKKENLESFIYLSILNNHLDRNKNEDISIKPINKNFNDLYRYNSIKENNILKEEIKTHSNDIIQKKRL